MAGVVGKAKLEANQGVILGLDRHPYVPKDEKWAATGPKLEPLSASSGLLGEKAVRIREG